MISFILPSECQCISYTRQQVSRAKRTLAHKSNNLDFFLAFTTKPTASAGCGLPRESGDKEEFQMADDIGLSKKNIY